MIKTIIFDLGGVILTLSQPQAIERFKALGLRDAEKHLDAYTQSGIFGKLELGEIDAETFRKELEAMVGHALTPAQCRHAWLGYCLEVPERNLRALTRLREEGYRLLLLSNTNPYMMSWVLSREFDGKGHSLEDYMDVCYMSYKMKMMKPDKRIFLEVMDRERLKPEETLFVDDGIRNTEVAKSVGLHVFCPLNGADWTTEIYNYLK